MNSLWKVSWGVLATFALFNSALAQDWEYRVLRGDTLWDVSARFLASPENDTPRLQEYNTIADPAHLRPGSTIRIPVDWLRVSPAPAEVVALSGVARVRASASEPETPARIGQLLWTGSILDTDAGSSATIGFADGSQLMVAADTQIVFDAVSTYSGTGMVDTHMRLLQGRIESRVVPAAGTASRFTVETPPATSTVRGTELRVSTDAAAQQTIAEVTAGLVDVASGDHRVELPAGFGLAVRTGQIEVQTRPLLPEPRIGALDEQALRVGSSVEWPAVEGALAYRMQVSSVRDSGPALSDTLWESPRGTLPMLDEGAYVLRLRAIDDDGIEGHDAVRALLLHDRPEPPFVIEPNLDDRMNPTRVRFRWTDSATAATYRLQLSDRTTFDRLLLDVDARNRTSIVSEQPLTDGIYYWRVAGRDQSGREGPFSDPQRFEIRSGPASPQLEQQGDAVVRWRASSADHRYQVQISRRDDFSTLLGEYELAEPFLPIDELPRKFYMRIRAVDAEGYSGPFGPAQYVDQGKDCTHCRLGIFTLLLLTIMLL